MSFFSRKKEIGLEEFCRDFYDTQILNPTVSKLDVGNVFVEVIKNNIVEVNPEFSKTESGKLNDEIKILRFELFALAWTHKFISGKIVICQSDFTKSYLQEKNRHDIWAGMQPYNDMIDGATLHWLTHLGKINLSFNYNVREELTKENIKVANELNIENDDRVMRVNHRILSENAWRQKLILGPIVLTLCERTGINAHDVNQEAQFRLAVMIKGLYDGSKQSWEKVKIKLP